MGQWGTAYKLHILCMFLHIFYCIFLHICLIAYICIYMVVRPQVKV